MLPEIGITRGGIRFPVSSDRTGGWCAPADIHYGPIFVEDNFLFGGICPPELRRAIVQQEEKHGKQGAGMSDYSYEALQLVDDKIEAERLMQEASKLEADLTAYGEDGYAEGSIFSFTFTDSNKKSHHIAVLKAGNDKWLTTGDRAVRTWSQLVRWLLTEGPTVRFADLTRLV